MRRGRIPSQPSDFWANVDRSAGPEGCWPWKLSTNKGYGQVRYQGRQQQAHRLAYELAVGPIPEGLDLDHVRLRGCVLTTCCNPAHLEPVTRSENQHRKPLATTCGEGHPKTPEHGRIAVGRKWACRTCGRIKARDKSRAARGAMA